MNQARLKTYSHLMRHKRIPTDYEVATSELLPYVQKGFEVEVPLADWYRKYQQQSPLSGCDWESFHDPRETTYTRYTALQRTREAHVDGILNSIEESAYDRSLTPSWMNVIEHVLPQLRYLFHAQQMLAAYVGQMAPSGRLTIAFAFQAGDEIRRVQRAAYRMAQLRLLHPEFGNHSKVIWEKDAAWQGVRRLIERMLVAYDWGEAFTALCLCGKPLLDDLFLHEFGRLASEERDPQFGEILFSLYEDSKWHRSLAKSLVELALQARATNATVFQNWIRRWLPEVELAGSSCAPALGSTGEERVQRVQQRTRDFLANLGIMP